MQASTGFATAHLSATHTVRLRGSKALAAYASYKAAVLLTNQSRWQPANGQATRFTHHIVNRAIHTVKAIVDPVDSFVRGELLPGRQFHAPHIFSSSPAFSHVGIHPCTSGCQFHHS